MSTESLSKAKKMYEKTIKAKGKGMGNNSLDEFYEVKLNERVKSINDNSKNGMTKLNAKNSSNTSSKTSIEYQKSSVSSIADDHKPTGP